MAWSVSPSNIPRNILLSMISGVLMYGCAAFYAFEKLQSLNMQLADEGWKQIEILSVNSHLGYLALYRKSTGADSAAILFVPDVKKPDSEFTCPSST